MITGQVFFELPPVTTVAKRITAGDQFRTHIRRMFIVQRVVTSPSFGPLEGWPT